MQHLMDLATPAFERLAGPFSPRLVGNLSLLREGKGDIKNETLDIKLLRESHERRKPWDDRNFGVKAVKAASSDWNGS